MIIVMVIAIGSESWLEDGIIIDAALQVRGVLVMYGC